MIHVQIQVRGFLNTITNDHIKVNNSKKPSSMIANQVKRHMDEGDDSNDNELQAIIVRDWRHQLQKTFLSHKTLPQPEAMPEIDELFKIIENYSEMTVEQLQFSKIGKVMRHICAIPDDRVPRDDEFRFRARAKTLVEKWHELLNANNPAQAAAHLDGKAEERGTEEITQATKDLNLNGKDGAPLAAKMAGLDTNDPLLAEVCGGNNNGFGSGGEKPPSPLVKKDDRGEGDESNDNDLQAIIVRDWRHKLQKTFLSHKTLPQPEAMPEIDQLFTTVENYSEMTVEQLQLSKIGKVMRHITAVSDERVPRDDEFSFRARAKALVEKWHELLNAYRSVESLETAAHLDGKEEKGTDEITQARLEWQRLTFGE